jgi:hypothetical protein
MRLTFCLVAGAVLTMTLTGCGDSPPETGPVPFKATTSPAIDSLKENMSNNLKGGVYTKKAADPGETKAATGKEAEKKP